MPTGHAEQRKPNGRTIAEVQRQVRRERMVARIRMIINIGKKKKKETGSRGMQEV